MNTIVTFVVFIVFGIGISIYALKENAFCITPNNENATCIKVRSCTPILAAIETKNKDVIDFARKSQCGYTDQPLVCCGSTGEPRTAIFQHRLLPPPTVCGLDVNKDKGGGYFTIVVYGGKPTIITDFPWMALLKYLEDGKERFGCGGTLIHQRYVLSAAHCTKLPPSGSRKLIGVRLGEYNISSSVDCTNNGKKCSEPVVDVGIERVINYPNFQRKLLVNDISLIRLDRAVQFTDFIRPICLPAEASSLPLRTSLTLTGWGETEISTNSDVKLEVKLFVASPTECGLKHRATISDSQFCAGGAEGRDSCLGDSGGPLMREGSNVHPNQWIQEGIVSFGSTDCGLVDTPGVYTRVSKYLKWIVNNLQ